MQNFTSPGVGGESKWNDSSKKSDAMIRAVRCAKCGKEIPLGQEVRKGFLVKKNYHKECVG
jgi:hypothetical protein